MVLALFALSVAIFLFLIYVAVRGYEWLERR